MYTEEDFLPLSAIQHLIFCERQCALIHLERIWADNTLTLEGRHLHKRVDEEAPRRELRGDLVILRGLPLHSYQLGLVGRADVVELHRYDENMDQGENSPELGLTAVFDNLPGRWAVVPVDYKRGKPKQEPSDRSQICAQALCLEEMLGVRIVHGYLYYGSQHKREEVHFTEDLRCLTMNAAKRLHELTDGGRTPICEEQPKCKNCSILEFCIPQVFVPEKKSTKYVEKCLSDINDEKR